MACLEHTCLNCRYCWFDNKRWVRCPKCGTMRIATQWDEELAEKKGNNKDGDSLS